MGSFLFVLPSLCLKREERLGCRGLESSHFFVSFSYVFHEYSITSCIRMLPPLSLIHFINEEIILVDDLFIFIISISLLDGIICLMLCS